MTSVIYVKLERKEKGEDLHLDNVATVKGAQM